MWSLKLTLEQQPDLMIKGLGATICMSLPTTYSSYLTR